MCPRFSVKELYCLIPDLDTVPSLLIDAKIKNIKYQNSQINFSTPKKNRVGQQILKVKPCKPLSFVCALKIKTQGYPLELPCLTGGPSRWRRSKMRRSPSSSQIYQKFIYVWNNSYRTPTERWQKTSDFPKCKKLPTYLGSTKEKTKNRDKRTGTGRTPQGGSCE